MKTKSFFYENSCNSGFFDSLNTALHRIAALLRFEMKPKVPVWAAHGELGRSANSQEAEECGSHQGRKPILTRREVLAGAIAIGALMRIRTALAKALIAANPDRVVWGTDWPHPSGVTPPGRKPTDVTPLLPIDDGRLLNQLAVWAPDPAIRKKILVINPARLYAF